ncbi:MAG: neutral zinc metallopeptidase [Microbacteriaceae bacterium]|jgi:hypothetical protein|nr:neutral zinc metallopeptidase [Microbacteriaceae bacterium]
MHNHRGLLIVPENGAAKACCGRPLQYRECMTFNDNSNIGNSKVRRRGRTTGLAVGGGGVGVIAIFLLSQLFGVDLGGLGVGVGGGGDASGDTELSECQVGEDANANVDCRMVGAYSSLEDYWVAQAPAIGIEYREPALILFDQTTTTGCGNASSATGPFYCPLDETIYIDTSFYADLRDRFGASEGTLAELYVVAHEFGHHIQQIGGLFEGTDRSDTGPGSDAIRLEVQADCFAGAWVAGASQTEDESGVPFLEPVTGQQVQDALSAASAVGDDRIQQSAGGGVNPETWTHGSSEQRQRWFSAGYDGGPGVCDTFATGADQL